ncbi:MAG TPA: septal ring lytic transglycosylase RlpA family protein [Smithella sp.]|nr:septal ring lytic transglycosylase RlpA family protein [Smithella sp.]
MVRNRIVVFFLLVFLIFSLTSCFIITVPYKVVKGTVKGTYYIVKGTYELTAGTTHLVYSIGKFTFKVARAPMDWPLTSDAIESIGGMRPKDAILKGVVKDSPYVVKGKTYCPMSFAKARSYEQTGLASWYGYESLRGKGDHMTANGEVFDPGGLSAAHKLLPIPMHVKVTNLENGRWIIVRVNDRGPFPSDHNAASGDRIIDLSEGAAKKLGFHDQGVAKVKVTAIELKNEG